MPCEDLHVSDQDLLLTADGELSTHRASRVRAHLAACWACRTRMAELEGTITDFMRLYRGELDARLPPMEGPAALLKAQLAEIGSARSGRERVWSVAVRVHRHRTAWAFVAVLALALASLPTLRDQVVPGTPVRRPSEVAADSVPRPSLTPGATVPVSRSDVCSVDFKQAPDVPPSLKQQVFAQYGIANPAPDAYEVDYLITPELGGSNSIRNLWPEPYFQTSWNARVKDALEDRLHRLVCDGELDLATAQREISADWISAYKKYFHTDRPLPAPSRPLDGRRESGLNG